jgi:acyl dehydratase
VTIDIPDPGALRTLLGQEVAVSEWVDVPQHRIDAFAAATEDRQWIHTDPARALAESPYKTTIAHGFLTLSLVSVMIRQAMRVGNVRMAVNYGVNRVRFMAPVHADSRIRGRFVPIAVEEQDGSVQVTWRITVEREHGDKPCCVAEWVIRYYAATPREPSRSGARDRRPRQA